MGKKSLSVFNGKLRTFSPIEKKIICILSESFETYKSQENFDYDEKENSKGIYKTKTIIRCKREEGWYSVDELIPVFKYYNIKSLTKNSSFPRFFNPLIKIGLVEKSMRKYGWKYKIHEEKVYRLKVKINTLIDLLLIDFDPLKNFEDYQSLIESDYANRIEELKKIKIKFNEMYPETKGKIIPPDFIIKYLDLYHESIEYNFKFNIEEVMSPIEIAQWYEKLADSFMFKNKISKINTDYANNLLMIRNYIMYGSMAERYYKLMYDECQIRKKRLKQPNKIKS